MVIVDLKRIAEAEGGIAVTDCALSVPDYFVEAERYAMLNAAQVGGGGGEEGWKECVCVCVVRGGAGDTERGNPQQKLERGLSRAWKRCAEEVAKRNGRRRRGGCLEERACKIRKRVCHAGACSRTASRRSHNPMKPPIPNPFQTRPCDNRSPA